MSLESPRREAGGVPPAVSVLMLVAICVVFVSIVGVWAFGLGEPAPPNTTGPRAVGGPGPPELSFSFTYYPDEDALRARFTGGEVVAAERLDLVVHGTPDADGRYDFTGALGAERGRFERQERVRLNRTTAKVAGPPALGSATVRVVWTSDDGAYSETVAIWLGPDA